VFATVVEREGVDGMLSRLQALVMPLDAPMTKAK
jgi:hypothetical protein